MSLDLCRMLVQPHCRVLTCGKTLRSKVQKVRFWTTKPILQTVHLVKTRKFLSNAFHAFQQESRVFFFHEKSQWFLVSKWVVLRSPRVVLSPRTSPRVAPIPFVGTGATGIQVGTCVDRVEKCWSSILHRKSWTSISCCLKPTWKQKGHKGSQGHSLLGANMQWQWIWEGRKASQIERPWQ